MKSSVPRQGSDEDPERVSEEEQRDSDVLTRRSFLQGAAGGLAGRALLGQDQESEPPPAGEAEKAADNRGPLVLTGTVTIELVINGEPRSVLVEPRTTLLSALRTRLNPPLTGTKEVCDRGACGACTVLLDGRPTYACMQLAADCIQKDITTIEGLAAEGRLTEVQQAFWEQDALMCGFCTPGFVMSVTACLEANPAATEGEIRTACAGNLCRCGTYPHVFAAAAAAGSRLQARQAQDEAAEQGSEEGALEEDELEEDER